MQKKVIILLVILIVSLLGVYYLSMSKPQKPPITQVGNPSPIIPAASPTLYRVPINTTGGNNLNIVSTSPVNNELSVPVDTAIVLSFNRSFNMNDLSFFIEPAVSFRMTQEQNNLVIIFNRPLEPATTYTYGLQSKNSQYKQLFL